MKINELVDSAPQDSILNEYLNISLNKMLDSSKDQIDSLEDIKTRMTLIKKSFNNVNIGSNQSR